MNNAHWLKNRDIAERVIIQGYLILETPAHFGSGDKGGLMDMPIILDPLEGRALLTGSSLAGALRSYLREREIGYGETGSKESLYMSLFGSQEDNEGEQSFIIIHDSIGEKPNVEWRDGVKIDPRTRIAKDKNKFDFELIEAGTSFPITIELLIQNNIKNKLIMGACIALEGLEKGEIPLGFRKRRGFGQCRVKEWRVCRYDLTKPDGLIGWLTNNISGQKVITNLSSFFYSDMQKSDSQKPDQREYLIMDALFSLDGPLLIGSNSDQSNAPDSIHLHSKRNQIFVPIISGTALAGAMRARALRIANTLDKKGNAKKIVEDIFGKDINSSEDKACASKLITTEKVIEKPLTHVQSRVKIDRFTGGAFPTALFNDQPIFGNNDTCVQLNIYIQQPTISQIGLLLLILKDLWTADLTIGGKSSIGRGRLLGKKANLIYKRMDNITQEWIIVQEKDKLEISGNKMQLEKYVQSFCKEVQG